MQEAFAKIIKKFKKIDVLVNCAGIISVGLVNSSKSKLELNEDKFAKTIRINVIGTFICS